jgi:hypothetical protein
MLQIGAFGRLATYARCRTGPVRHAATFDGSPRCGRCSREGSNLQHLRSERSASASWATRAWCALSDSNAEPQGKNLVGCRLPQGRMAVVLTAGVEPAPFGS